MTIMLNGEAREVPTGATIADILVLFLIRAEGRGVAVALAGEVVPRADWGTTELTEGAQVEVVAAIQGG